MCARVLKDNAVAFCKGPTKTASRRRSPRPGMPRAKDPQHGAGIHDTHMRTTTSVPWRAKKKGGGGSTTHAKRATASPLSVVWWPPPLPQATGCVPPRAIACGGKRTAQTSLADATAARGMKRGWRGASLCVVALLICACGRTKTITQADRPRLAESPAKEEKGAADETRPAHEKTRQTMRSGNAFRRTRHACNGYTPPLRAVHVVSVTSACPPSTTRHGPNRGAASRERIHASL